MLKWLLTIVLAVLAGILFYRLGIADCRTETLIVEKEVKRDADYRKAKIYAAPAADRAELLKLMYGNIL